MTLDINFLCGGEAGQGIQSVGLILARTMTNGGYHIFADQDYESRIRGGHNFFRIRISDHNITSISEELDVIVALNRETIELHKNNLKPGGAIIYDSAEASFKGEEYLDIPLAQLAEEAGRNKIMMNTAAVGAAVGLTSLDFSLLEKVLVKEFNTAGGEILANNLKTARAGYDFVRRGSRRLNLPPVTRAEPKMLLSGNDSLAIGALAGGCKFVAGYPMTPSSSILEYLARKSNQYGIVMVHVEDEIAAINMAVGAGYAGARALVATSGGGFSLMVEGLSLAGMTETPVVIVLGQRPGPATGLPTRTEQGELWFALHAGHGEFPRAVLAPATAAEAFTLTIKAFNMAEKYQIPVIILTDHHLASSYNTVSRFDLTQVHINRGDLLSEEEANKITGYQRHQITASGISPRALPGLGKALVVTDSDEHDEAGHLIEDAGTRIRLNEKRLRKGIKLQMEISAPFFSNIPKAELNLIGWGSTYGAIHEAAEILQAGGIAVNHLHLSEIWPFPVDAVAQDLNNNARNIVIESNATSQMAALIRRETGIKIERSILRYDGRPISAQYIINRLKKEIK